MTQEKRDCDCDDWNKNIEAINGPTKFYATRFGTKGYYGKQFVYCPWCAKRLPGEALTIEACPECGDRGVVYEMPRADDRFAGVSMRTCSRGCQSLFRSYNQPYLAPKE